MKKQSGFTFIELVIVVVILGFLAVTAIPKFLDLTDQAKQANLEGMAGGFATAVSLARAQWEAEGRPQDANTNFVNYDGSELYLTTPADKKDPDFRPGYPMGTGTTGTTTGDMTGALCKQVWDNILSQPPKITATAGDLVDANGVEEQYFAVALTGAGDAGTNGNDTCAFYLIATLDKITNGYDTPTDTTKGNNFTYDPASSRVEIIINN